MKESGYYPPGAEFDSSAPYNQTDVSEKDFEVTCSQSLSKTVTITTNNYIPGASGVDCEPDGEGGYYASVWQDPDDTSDTNWSKEYDKCGYLTPLQLIQLFKIELEKQYNECNEATSEGKIEAKRLKHLIEECDCWNEDETEYSID
jgi:hypothetical protein